MVKVTMTYHHLLDVTDKHEANNSAMTNLDLSPFFAGTCK